MPAGVTLVPPAEPALHQFPFPRLPFPFGYLREEKKAARRMNREKMERVTWVRPVVRAELEDLARIPEERADQACDPRVGQLASLPFLRLADEVEDYELAFHRHVLAPERRMASAVMT